MENLPSLGLASAKNTHRIKKSLKQKLFGIELRTKKLASAYVHLPPSGARRLKSFPSCITTRDVKSVCLPGFSTTYRRTSKISDISECRI